MCLIKMRDVFSVYMVTAVSIYSSYSHFLGGTVSWMQDINNNKIRFTYRLTWEKGSGPCGSSCSPVQMGTSVTGFVNSSLWSDLRWKYSDGIKSGNLSDVSYYVTSVSKHGTLGWEQGENSFYDYGIFFPNNSYKVFLNDIPWIMSSSDTTHATGYMETRLDLRQRSDTGKINNSPYVSLQPYLGIAFASSTRVRLPAEDQDGDIVRCRLAKPDECKTACTTVPLKAVKISKSDCTITVHAYKETNMAADAIYRLAIVIEDFPHGLIQMEKQNFTRLQALSTIPLQFTLKTSSANGSYSSHQVYVVNPYARKYYPTSWDPMRNPVGLSIGLSLHADDLNSTEFMASLPRFMTYVTNPDPFNNTNIFQRVNLLPKASQYGYMQICFWALRSDGVSRDSGCRAVTINDKNNCFTKTCANNGSCINIYNASQDVCQCHVGYKPPDCLTETKCIDNPCENNATCLRNGSTYSCSCTNGFRGVSCEIQKDKCLSSPCKNNGTCLDSQAQYVCLCPKTYTGSTCQTLVTDETEQSKSSSSKVIIPVTASIGGLAAIAGISALIYKFKTTSTTNTGYKSTRIRSLNSRTPKRNHVAADNTRPKNLNF